MVTKASPFQNIIKIVFTNYHWNCFKEIISNSFRRKLLTNAEPSKKLSVYLWYIYSFFFNESSDALSSSSHLSLSLSIVGLFHILYKNIRTSLSLELLFNVFWNFYIPSVCLTLSNVVFVSFVNVMFIFKWEHQENKNTKFPKSESEYVAGAHIWISLNIHSSQ